MIKTFISSNEKNIIRKIDKEFIKDEYNFHKKKLRYFGLPGERLLDIIEWKEYIENFTAVEKGGKFPEVTQGLLVSKAIELGIYPKMTLLRGDIIDMISINEDDVGQKISYPFELINLDYGGSILYEDRKRINAFEILISRQRPVNFLLFITSNIREFDIKELIETQKRIREDIISFREDLCKPIDEYFRWINERESVLRQIIHLHYLLKYLAEQKGYKIICYPAFLYEGSKGTKLLRYTFRFRYVPEASTKVHSDQSLIDILKQSSQTLVTGQRKDIEHPPDIF